VFEWTVLRRRPEPLGRCRWRLLRRLQPKVPSRLRCLLLFRGQLSSRVRDPPVLAGHQRLQVLWQRPCLRLGAYQQHRTPRSPVPLHRRHQPCRVSLPLLLLPEHLPHPHFRGGLLALLFLASLRHPPYLASLLHRLLRCPVSRQPRHCLVSSQLRHCPVKRQRLPCLVSLLHRLQRYLADRRAQRSQGSPQHLHCRVSHQARHTVQFQRFPVGRLLPLRLGLAECPA